MFLCPSDQDRLTDAQRRTTITWQTRAGPTATTAATLGAFLNGPCLGPFIWSIPERTSALTFGGSSLSCRWHHGRPEQHRRLQRARQGDRFQYSARPRPCSTRWKPTASIVVPPAVDNNAKDAQAYYKVCKVTPPTPAPATGQTCRCRRPDDNISGAMLGLGPARTYTLPPRHAAQHVELSLGAADRPRGEQPSPWYGERCCSATARSRPSSRRSASIPGGHSVPGPAAR